ncbi:putative sugar phosphate/phosphate translocator [Camellia lanceoleosa]|uniref:Sugar phosphate/phosphate translocator n=1 Tax=Camellia lanceoleosa TaxID=1840588 RepID=A0ACC0J3I6_9ERIC|nr:putative sugar phosphate/phosphate translocator [Camellia lanceoleosa]
MEVRDDLSREMCQNISFPLGFVLILEPLYVSPMLAVSYIEMLSNWIKIQVPQTFPLVVVFYFHDQFTWLKGAGLITILSGVSLFNWYK